MYMHKVFKMNAKENEGSDTLTEKSPWVNTKLSAKIIRKGLKSKCKTFSVKMATGTAYGWIDIWGSGEFDRFTDEEKEALKSFGMSYGSNCASIAPEDRNYYINKMIKEYPELKKMLEEAN